MEDEIYIFSDESGCWDVCSGSDYYVRSWIKIDPNNYENYKKYLNELKGISQGQEIKWQLIKNNFENMLYKTCIENLLSIDFSIFITISITSCANDRIENMKTFSKINSLQENELTGYIDGNIYNDNCASITKSRLIKTVKHFLFMATYEKWHFINAKAAFSDHNSIKWFLDNPSCTKDLHNFCYDLENNNISLVDSKKEPGIQLSDIIAGCYKDLLKQPIDSEANKVFLKYFKPRQIFIDKLPNPNVIFANDSCSEALIDIIKSNVWKKTRGNS
ncbi:DUF3800 domain-containing protein [bacterium]|nr:DUF3800 domain-containing protein [bacterium]